MYHSFLKKMILIHFANLHKYFGPFFTSSWERLKKTIQKFGVIKFFYYYFNKLILLFSKDTFI